MERLNFGGLSLGGPQSEKSALAYLEYFPNERTLFLSDICPLQKASVQTISSDEALVKQINTHTLEYLAVDRPLGLPKCLRCRLSCPGHTQCRLPAIEFLRRHKKKIKKSNTMTPYLERCAEVWLATQLDEKFSIEYALGSNSAPLTARLHYLQRHISQPLIQTQPKINLWYIGRKLGLRKISLRFQRNDPEGVEYRKHFLGALVGARFIFLYQDDIRQLIHKPALFDAFLCSLGAYLKWRRQTTPRPKDFPRGEDWIEFPCINFEWFPK